jgi:hypothetical protein
MFQTILLISGMVLVTAFARRKLRSGSTVCRDKLDAGRHSVEKVKMAADNLKAAAKKVDDSAAAVETALKGLMAA